jgi:hypothetical protein
MARPRKKPATRPSAAPVAGYLERTHRPLNCLAFLLPLLVAYQVSSFFFPDRLLAPQHMQWFFGLFGATWGLLPPVLIVVVLLAWHVLLKERWHVDFDAVAGMLLESLLLWIPLVVLNILLTSLLAGNGAALEAAAETARPVGPAVLIFRKIGAAIYEEFLFRLAAMNLVLLLAVDLAGLPRKAMVPVAVVLSSVAFGLYHHVGAGAEPFDWLRLGLRTVMAAYLAVVYVARGLGVAVGTHACYNVVVFLMSDG